MTHEYRIVLADLLGLEYAKAAETIGWLIGRINRARARMHATLQGYNNITEAGVEELQETFNG